jgi:hypothetical protein
MKSFDLLMMQIGAKPFGPTPNFKVTVKDLKHTH